MRIAVKIGSSTLTYATGSLNLRTIEKICRIISDLQNAGNQVLLISSGAVALGVGKLSLPQKPKDMAGKQAAAAVGQCELMYFYDREFSQYNRTVAQILLTGSDVKDPERSENLKNTLEKLLDMNVIPIFNENDTIATDEIKVGDNDTLSAIVACEAKADLLIILSDIDGLYTADPRKDPNAKLIPKVTEVTEEIMAVGGGAGSSLGTGGMHTKLLAAKICLENGIDMVIANSKNLESLYDIVDGKQVGTLFSGRE